MEMYWKLSEDSEGQNKVVSTERHMSMNDPIFSTITIFKASI